MKVLVTGVKGQLGYDIVMSVKKEISKQLV